MMNFAKGIYFRLPSQKAPNWVIGNMSFKRLEVLEWLEKQEGEWVDLSVLMGKSGKPYVAVSTWKKGEESLEDEMTRRANNPRERTRTEDEEQSEIAIEDIPF